MAGPVERDCASIENYLKLDSILNGGGRSSSREQAERGQGRAADRRVRASRLENDMP